IAERERLFRLLSAQPYLRAFPSHGNFILCELADPRLSLGELRAQMEAHGLILRYFRTPDLARHVRITVGASEHTDLLAYVLAAIGRRLGAPVGVTAATHAP